MNAALENETTRPVWAWYYATPREMQRALEEYTAFQGDHLVKQAEPEPVDNTPTGKVDPRELAKVAARYGLRLSTDEAGGYVYGDDGNPLLEVDPDAEPRDPDTLATQQLHAAQRRSEIDACMDALPPRLQYCRTLLDLYYRRGLNLEPRGWVLPYSKVAPQRTPCPPLRRCPASPGDNRTDWKDCRHGDRCTRDRAAFEVLLALAIGCLFDAHRVRREQHT